MRSATAAIIATAPTGWAPTAVSCESITASVPSRIAFATSATSARVGRLEWTIESSICVAVIDGRASAPASFSSRFCTSGTSSIGNSMPRSPRATITQSAARRTDSMFSTACGFSILATSGRRVCSRTNSTSAAERTNDSATRSTPIDSPWREQLEVALGHRREAVDRPGDVQALPRGDGAADLDLGVQLAEIGARRGHAQAHRAVGEIDDRARLDRLRQLLPGDRHPPLIAEDLPAALEGQRLAGRQLDDPVAQPADAQLRPGQVLEQRHGPPDPRRRGPHALRGLGVLFEGAV